MSRDPLPEPWRSALERKGIHSMRGLATRAGLSPQTAKRLIDGTGSPAFSTVDKIAQSIFGGDREYVWGLVGEPRQDHGPWEIPEDVVSQLDEEQRAALLAVARAMVPASVRKRGEHGGDTAPTRDDIEPKVLDVLDARRRREEEREGLGRAARHSKSQGKAQHKALEGLGEESQDDGGFGPA